MEADFTHSTQQQHPHKHVNPTQTQDIKKHLPDNTLHTHTPQQTHKMGDFHLPITADQNIFKHTGIKIAFKCDNTNSQLSKPPSRTPPTTPNDRPSIYFLSCLTYNEEYFGQTSRSLELRYKEHERYIKYNNPQSAYALHIRNNQHQYGPIDKTMTLLKPLKITSLLSPYEHCFIQSLYKPGRLISEQDPGPAHPLLQLAYNPSLPHFDTAS
jgi:hypothetical protein